MESGLPEGVFNIVHGDKECVDALLAHPLVRAVSFVGSTAVARHVYMTGTQNGKRVQAAGGAKNHLIIMPDADLDQAVGALQLSAFGCAASAAWPAALPCRSARSPIRWSNGCASRAGSMKVGATDGGADVDMGPVITREHLDRVAGYVDIGKQRRGRRRPRRPVGRVAQRRLPDRPQRARPRRALDESRARRNLRPGALGHPRRMISRQRWRSAATARTATARRSSPAAAGRHASSNTISTRA